MRLKFLQITLTSGVKLANEEPVLGVEETERPRSAQEQQYGGDLSRTSMDNYNNLKLTKFVIKHKH